MTTRPQLLPASDIHVWRWRRTAGRQPLLAILGDYLKRPVAESDIACDALGKPALAGTPLHFSVSHSGAWTALAVSTAPVGLDMERIAPLPEMEDLVELTLAPAERAALAACAPAERERFFYRCWTRKEALLKGMGCGLSVDPRLADTASRGAWNFHEIATIAGCAACVATELAHARVVSRQQPWA